MQLVIPGGIASPRGKAFIDQPAGTGKPDRSRIIQWLRNALLDDVKCLPVDDPDFVKRMDMMVRRKHRAVSERPVTQGVRKDVQS